MRRIAIFKRSFRVLAMERVGLVGGVVADRNAVRVAALRALLRLIGDRDHNPPPLSTAEEQAARLLLSGRDVADICNALSVSPAVLLGMLLTLAR